MDSYFRGSSSAAAESTQIFAYNMMISGVLVIMITNFVFPMLMQTALQSLSCLFSAGQTIIQADEAHAEAAEDDVLGPGPKIPRAIEFRLASPPILLLR